MTEYTQRDYPANNKILYVCINADLNGLVWGIYFLHEIFALDISGYLNDDWSGY